jgi:D-glycero-D-manno-heptose 1,7-bisphosphate phosphatase
LFRIEECRFIDGIFDVVAAFRDHGYAVVIATNQAGIGRGYYSEEDFAVLMEWIKVAFRSQNASIDAVYYSPDHPTEGIGKYRRESDMRKPNPGMLQAGRDLSLDLKNSWMVGDKLTDIDAGRAAGVANLVLHEPQASAVEKCGDYWKVSQLREICALLAKLPNG